MPRYYFVRDKVTKQCPQATTFEERGAEAESNRGPSAYQPNAFPLAEVLLYVHRNHKAY